MFIVMPYNFMGLRGATVARLTPDQKVACSNHVGVIRYLFLNIMRVKSNVLHFSVRTVESADVSGVRVVPVVLFFRPQQVVGIKS